MARMRTHLTGASRAMIRRLFPPVRRAKRRGKIGDSEDLQDLFSSQWTEWRISKPCRMCRRMRPAGGERPQRFGMDVPTLAKDHAGTGEITGERTGGYQAAISSVRAAKGLKSLGFFAGWSETKNFVWELVRNLNRSGKNATLYFSSPRRGRGQGEGVSTIERSGKSPSPVAALRRRPLLQRRRGEIACERCERITATSQSGLRASRVLSAARSARRHRLCDR